MVKLTTRAKNVNQHPGETLAKGRVKQRTPAQKAVDDQDGLKEKEASTQLGVAQIAAMEDRIAAEEAQELNNPPRPRPRVRQPSRKAIEAAEDIAAEQSLDEVEAVGAKGNNQKRQASNKQSMETNPPAGREIANLDGKNIVDERGDRPAGKGRLRKNQRTTQRDAIQAARQIPALPNDKNLACETELHKNGNSFT